jgi:hypothetical protein
MHSTLIPGRAKREPGMRVERMARQQLLQTGSTCLAAIGFGAAPAPGFMWNS